MYKTKTHITIHDLLFINRGIDLQGNCLRKDIVLNTETYKLNLLNCITILYINCLDAQLDIISTCIYS